MRANTREKDSGTVGAVKALSTASILGALLAGCTGSVTYRAAVVAPPPPAVVVETPPPAPPPEPEPAVVEVAYVEPAAYVYINPQVQVIEDYDYPVFFSDGMYWRFEGGVWYSSSYHDRGWITATTVPVYVRSIDRPTQYVHYRANASARPGQPGYRQVPTAPIRHTAPPPRFVEQPGHPVHPEHPMHPEHPEHPVTPGHPVEAAQPMPPQHEHPAPMPPSHGEPGRPAAGAPPAPPAHAVAPPPAAHPAPAARPEPPHSVTPPAKGRPKK